ncbi:hypothetical protein [Winogradskyella sp.]|uniref:hypothetical protein n=1 Tax=Winogradskyella sp. TaxID=1883156 RepID=UPI003BA9467D
MKRILTFMTLLALVLTACEGDPGPPGPQGFPGQDAEIAPGFEIVLDFTPQNNYEFIEPYGFEVRPFEVVLVYLQDGSLNGQEAWRLLPQTFFLPNGNPVDYNYDFTQSFVRFFIDTEDFSLLTSEFLLEQVFRVIIVPAENIGRVDLSDLNAVMNLYGIESFERR